MAAIVEFQLKQGRWTLPKDPDDSDWYGVDVTNFLPDGVTIVNDPLPPAALVAGVALAVPPGGGPNVRIQGTQIIAFLTGLAVGDDVEPDDNCCTFRFYLSNGARRDRSIYFNRKDY